MDVVRHCIGLIAGMVGFGIIAESAMRRFGSLTYVGLAVMTAGVMLVLMP